MRQNAFAQAGHTPLHLLSPLQLLHEGAVPPPPPPPSLLVLMLLLNTTTQPHDAARSHIEQPWGC